MAKKLHLICNAHLDPVWQWEWEEGAAETLSTFRIAADFCDEYDQFVFCHNEALLYQWIEEYDPALFERIRKLVKAGKWCIMGGWHLQPDCNMPSGEAFVRQTMSGRKYFMEKFGIAPKIAVNLDPFGHSRGLVQILRKSGYDGYLFMRPDEHAFHLPASDFKWVGYDGSEVTAVRIHGGYNSKKGQAEHKVRDYIDLCKEDDFFLCLWGIGNHGGGPSKKDLDDLKVLAEEQAADGVELVHSTPDAYFAEVREKRELPEVATSLRPFAVGCYTSQVRIKQKCRQAENVYLMTESMCAHASEQKLIAYPEKELAEAMYDILTVQFHDMLPGSSIQPAEEMSIRMLDHALEILSRLKARAFFALASGQKKAPEDRIPVFAYNPYPYRVTGDFVSEFMLWDQNWNPEFMMPQIYGTDGEMCPSQCEKEYSTIPLEWRKRVVFHATLEPMQLNRFECGFQAIPKKPVPEMPHDDSHYCFEQGGLSVKINRKTGLVDQLAKDGVEYVKPGAFALEVFADNFDPWYMDTHSWEEKVGEFTLLNPEEAMEFCHTDAPIEGVHVIESGAVRTVLEAVFGYKSSRAVVKYQLSNFGELKTEVRIVWNEKQKLIKMNIPAALPMTECIGEQAYGREELVDGLRENVSQRYIAMCFGENALLAINNGIYGSSMEKDKGNLKMTLLRSPSYTAHPLPGRITMPQDRYMPYIEQGERDFAFQFAVGKKQEILDDASRLAQHFNRAPMILSFYPTGAGEIPGSPVRLEGTEIVNLEAFKRAEDGNGYILRLFNPTGDAQTATVRFESQKKELAFGAYEIKTLRCTADAMEECPMMERILGE